MDFGVDLSLNTDFRRFRYMKKIGNRWWARLAVFICSLFMGMGQIEAQETYHTQIYKPKRIKSLQVVQPDQTFTVPVISLGSGEQILINFDDLTPNYERYAYSVIHCDADWKKSSLNELEYMQGFQGLTIDDFANSFNTTTQYTNYQLLLPNDDVQLKVSGNYAVRIYHEDHPEETVLVACFSVEESEIGIAAEVTGNTLVDTYQRHQQVNFSVLKKNLNITHPQTDLKIRVVQNNRPDNVVRKIMPSGILSDRIVYENLRELIFPAGNEYRRMEFLSSKYNGMRVEGISYHNPYYHVDLMKDYPSSMATYEYDQDQNGRFYVACSRCDDANTEADYYIVHFTLAMPEAKGGKVYLNGDFMQNTFDANSEMVFNPDSRQYEKAILLKQGNYNYQYLYVPEGETTGQTGSIEGDFHQTENEYTIYVYFRPMGTRYDRLIGVQTVHINGHN